MARTSESVTRIQGRVLKSRSLWLRNTEKGCPSVRANFSASWKPKKASERSSQALAQAWVASTTSLASLRSLAASPPMRISSAMTTGMPSDSEVSTRCRSGVFMATQPWVSKGMMVWPRP